MSESAVRVWSEARGMSVSDYGALQYERAEYRCIEIDCPPEAERRLALAYALVMTATPDDNESRFPGCLLRVADRDIWSETFSRLGQRVLELTGMKERKRAKPSFLCEKGEIVDAQLLVTLPLMLRWDAYMADESASFIAFLSHDGPLELTTASPVWFERIFQRFDEGGWVPRERIRRDKL